MIILLLSFMQPHRSDPDDPSTEPSAEELAEAATFKTYALLFPQTFSVFTQFLSRWVEAVPELTLLGKSNNRVTANPDIATDGDPDADPEAQESEFVEQEGCPEDTDFNRWSHHTSVGTCEDQIMQHSLGDSGAVSFVFGLEVNWSLLESREAQYREENELRKEQQRLDLEELNEQRRLKKEGLLNPAEAAASSKKSKAGNQVDHSDSDDSESGRTNKDLPKMPKKKRKSDVVSEEGVEPSVKKKKTPSEKKRKSVDAIEGRDVGGRAEDLTEEIGTTSATKKPKRNLSAGSPVPYSELVFKSAASSRRATSATSIDPLVELDHSFQADWEYVRRAYEKGKIPSFENFQAVLKQLKLFNNNWRVLPLDYTNPNTPTLYTRIPGMKTEARFSYRLGFDYFVGEAGLMRFIYAQAGLLGDAALVRDAVQAMDQQPPVVNIDAQPKGTSSALPHNETVCASDEAIKTRQPCAPAVQNDIDFGDSDSDSQLQSRNKANKSTKSTIVAPVSSAVVKRLARKVIADSDEDDEVEGAAQKKSSEISAAVFDLTSPTQCTQNTETRTSAVPLTSTSVSRAVGRVQLPYKGQENLPPNAHSSTAPPHKAVKSPSTLAKEDVQIRPKDTLLLDKRPLSAAPFLSSTDSHNSCNSLGSKESDEVAVDWTCTFCTLQNSVRHDPTECNLCG